MPKPADFDECIERVLKRDAAANRVRAAHQNPRTGPHLDQDEIAQIVAYNAEGMSQRNIARLVGRSRTSVQAVLNRVKSTVLTATAVLQAGALTMAERIVADANVDQCIDVLRDEQIGALLGVRKQTTPASQQVSILVGMTDRPALAAPTPAQYLEAEQKMLTK